MAVKIRLRRLGRKKRPLYGVVAADSRFPRDGRFIEDLGRYSPMEEPAEVTLNDERVLYWLEQGAEPTDTVRSLLSRQGLMLALHLRRKGSEADAVWEAVTAHREKHSALAEANKKVTAKDRREMAMKAEATIAAKAEAEEAKARAEADAAAKAAADAARAKAEEEAKLQREAAVEAARLEQIAKNEAQVAEDAALGKKPEVTEDAAPGKKPKVAVDAGPGKKTKKAKAAASDESVAKGESTGDAQKAATAPAEPSVPAPTDETKE